MPSPALPPGMLAICGMASVDSDRACRASAGLALRHAAALAGPLRAQPLAAGLALAQLGEDAAARAALQPWAAHVEHGPEATLALWALGRRARRAQRPERRLASRQRCPPRPTPPRGAAAARGEAGSSGLGVQLLRPLAAQRQRPDRARAWRRARGCASARRRRRLGRMAAACCKPCRLAARWRCLQRFRLRHAAGCCAHPLTSGEGLLALCGTPDGAQSPKPDEVPAPERTAYAAPRGHARAARRAAEPGA